MAIVDKINDVQNIQTKKGNIIKKRECILKDSENFQVMKYKL